MTMDSNPIRVAVNGYGVIGKRVTDAVALQDDMEVVGVSDVATDYRVRLAALHGYPIFASTPDARGPMEEAGIEVHGLLQDLLGQADIVVDCTPKGIGAKNRPAYEQAGIKAIWQGGEKHDVAGFSFVPEANYEEALGRQYARVVSCNTNGIVKVCQALLDKGLLASARIVVLRRATDPFESHEQGIINTIVPEDDIPSHQGPDAQTVIPGLDVVTVAAKVPENVGHNHYFIGRLTRPATGDEVLQAFRDAPRIAFVRYADGVEALNVTRELMLELARPRADMWEVSLWEDVLTVQGDELYCTYQVDNQAIVIPSTVDCIRALTGRERSKRASIEKTDRSLGVLKEFVPGRPGGVARSMGPLRAAAYA